MAGYRLYFLRNEHIEHATSFECADDGAAINTTREHMDGRAMELWSGARLIRRFPAEPAAAKPIASAQLTTAVSQLLNEGKSTAG